jgi:signal transduction histidine kinase
MLEFARVKELHLIPVQLPEILDSVLEFVEQRLEASDVRVERAYPGDVPAIQADPDQMHEVFLNLILNAADAMKTGGILRVSVGSVRSAHPEGNGVLSEYLSVRFQDSGEGISPEHLKRVFDPFFTTKAVGKGTGLGMSVSYGIVREHGGWVDVASERGAGTTVTVFLPLSHAGDEALRGTGS